MVRLVFRANKPMKIGVLLMAFAALLLIASIVLNTESVALRATGIGLLIVAAIFYMAGRMKQIMGQRPR